MDTVTVLPGSVVPLIPAIALTALFGVEGFVFGVPLTVLVFVVLASPWRIRAGGGMVAFDYLPFGLMSRTWPARSISGEIGIKTVVLDLPKRVLLRETVWITRGAGASRIIETLRAEGASIDRPV